MLKALAMTSFAALVQFHPAPPAFGQYQFGLITEAQAAKAKSSKKHCVWRRENGRSKRVCTPRRR